MFAAPTAIALFLLPFLKSAAQDAQYTVWSSVIYSRTGERTPVWLVDDIPIQLTSRGAQQQYSVGQYLRQRYLGPGTNNGVGGAPIPGLSAETIDSTQLYISAWGTQYSIASAQAFMQGFYPPFSLDGNNTEAESLLDPTSIVANSSGSFYVASPLNGYQYPLIQSYSFNDPDIVYMAGMYECPAFEIAVGNYLTQPSTFDEIAATNQLYSLAGIGVLDDVLDQDQWNFGNAYPIFDYINYQVAHNTTVANMFSSTLYVDQKTGITALDRLRWYADQQQYSLLGNAYAINNISSDPFPGTVGSISTIAGNFLASQMLGLLQEAIISEGQSNKINLMFGDFQPLTSLFSLLGLPPYAGNFYGLPDFASVAIFELFSHTNDPTTFPAKEDDLWIRFYFANGTANDTNFQAYPMFNFGPDYFDMPWTQWQSSMYDLVAGDVGDWCNQCGAQNIFCAFWNGSDSLDAASLSSGSASHHVVSPAVGGVIGAVVALVVAGMLFGLLMLLGGIRFHRIERRRHGSDVGGYKGSQKMASDKDLVLPKGGAVVGATVETQAEGSPNAAPVGAHERVGSWELRQKEESVRRPSYEDELGLDDVGATPFRKPTLPDERV